MGFMDYFYGHKITEKPNFEYDFKELEVELKPYFDPRGWERRNEIKSKIPNITNSDIEKMIMLYMNEFYKKLPASDFRFCLEHVHVSFQPFRGNYSIGFKITATFKNNDMAELFSFSEICLSDMSDFQIERLVDRMEYAVRSRQIRKDVESCTHTLLLKLKNKQNQFEEMKKLFQSEQQSSS